MSKIIPPIEITEEAPAYRRISWWIENTIVRVVKRSINSVSGTIRDILSFSITDTIEQWEKELIPWVRPLADEILSIPGLPEYVKLPIRNAMAGTNQVGLAVIALLVGVGASGVHQGFSGVLGAITHMWLDRKIRSNLMDVGTATLMLQRRIIDENYWREVMATNGVRDEDMDRFWRLADHIQDDTTITQLYWRGQLTGIDLLAEMRKKGYTAEQVDQWQEVRKVIPSPNELIGIAVREGFNDSVAAKFGYDEDYPTEAAMWAEKQGMSQTFFKAAWRAHWTLPGLVQVREMYHRNIINEDDLKTYLRAADIPIFWRGAIIKWMDRVVTRVDARRMYDLGIWDEKRVFAHHKELGYNDDDAGDMTMWVALNYMSDDRDLTKSDILTMYQDGILSDMEATGYLTALDYKPQAISLLLAHRDLKRDEAYERQIISNVKALFVGGLYDRTDVFAKLGKIATPDAVIRQSLAVWDLEKERKVAVPTSTQLRDMVIAGVIDITEFVTEMRNKKYPDKYINWYVGLWFKED